MATTDNLATLYRWQLKGLHEFGIDNFNIFSRNRMDSGRMFHLVVESLLNELKTYDRIISTVEEALLNQPNGRKYIGELKGYLTGVRSFLSGLASSNRIRLESKVCHPLLCYVGKFDAIIELDGELTLVDWKTVSYASERRNNDTETSLSNLYNNPMQIAAYVAAVNSDPAYRLLPPITHAAIVLAYKDGRDVEVLRMSEQDIQVS